MREVGLGDVAGAALEEFAELGAADEPLAGRDRDAGGAGDLGGRLDVLGWAGFLEEQQAVRLECLAVLDRHARPGAGVEIDHQVDRGADGFADGADEGFGIVHLRVPSTGSVRGTGMNLRAV